MANNEKERPVYKELSKGLSDEEALEMIKQINRQPICLMPATDKHINKA